jgi:hypothetical protein
MYFLFLFSHFYFGVFRGGLSNEQDDIEPPNNDTGTVVALKKLELGLTLLGAGSINVSNQTLFLKIKNKKSYIDLC